MEMDFQLNTKSSSYLQHNQRFFTLQKDDQKE